MLLIPSEVTVCAWETQLQNHRRHTYKIITEKFWKGELLFDAVGGNGRGCEV